MGRVDHSISLAIRDASPAGRDYLGEVKTLSYNVEKDRASGELTDLVTRLDIDVACLQEVDARKLPERIGPLQLADATRRNRLGLAIYAHPDRYTARATRAFALKKSLHDMIALPAAERLLASHLTEIATGRELIVASFHAAPLTALNSLRRKQIASAHRLLEDLGPTLPHLMVGDYNYPLFQNSLSRLISGNGYDLTLSDSLTYTRYKYVRGHFDFATSKLLSIDSVETLPQGKSDHMAIVVSSSFPEQGSERIIRAATPAKRRRSGNGSTSAATP